MIPREELHAVLDDVELVLQKDPRQPTYVSATYTGGRWTACIASPSLELTSVFPRVDAQKLNTMSMPEKKQ